MRDLSDPTQERELRVVAALRHAGAAAGPRSDEVDRMRRRIVAGMHGSAHEVAVDDRPRGTTPPDPSSARRRRKRVAAEARGRLVVATAAALCLLLALSGMSLVLSQNAMPGDMLYAFKRTAETAKMGLTFGERDRALQHLEFASTRANEVAVMATRTDENDALSPPSDRFRETLDDLDADVSAAIRLLGSVAVSRGGAGDALASLASWAQQQQQQLRSIRDELPQAVSSRLTSSIELLGRVQQRATELAERSDCPVMAAGRDELGPVPAEGSCTGGQSGGSSVVTPLPDRDRSEAQDAAESGDRPEQPATGTRQDSQQDRPQQSQVAPKPDEGDIERLPDRLPLDELVNPRPEPERQSGTPSQSETREIPIPLPGPDISIPRMLPDQPEVEVG